MCPTIRKISGTLSTVRSTDESVILQDIFMFHQQGVSSEGRVLGEFSATGFRPKFAAKLKASGIALPGDMFEPVVRV